MPEEVFAGEVQVEAWIRIEAWAVLCPLMYVIEETQRNVGADACSTVLARTHPVRTRRAFFAQAHICTGRFFYYGVSSITFFRVGATTPFQNHDPVVLLC